ncbi:MAG TPA: guanine deaminase [Chthoniobacterales bacterium]|jgi:guanine deaminase
MSDTPAFGIRGYLIDAPIFGTLRSWPDGALVIENGKIAEMGDYDTVRKTPRPDKIRWLHGPHALVVPGLIDLHAHLPQYPSVAKAGGELLPWLRRHIFPVEKEFTGAIAKKQSALFFDEVARHGTTSIGLFTAIYEDSCDAAFAAAEKKGTRAIIGKVMMDVGSYGSLQPRKVLSISLLETERLIKKWHGANEGLLEYAVSPRFAVSCSEKMMRGAAELATQYGTYVQTHLSENTTEIDMVRHLFPNMRDYTDVYDQCGLLGAKTLLGHAIHLSERETDVIRERQSRIVHCPTSNLFLGSGIMPLFTWRQRGLTVGLGSDVAAGPEINLWQVMRSAVESQQARSYYDPELAPISTAEAFHLATAGGADVLGKSAKIGTLHAGKEADITVIDIASLLPYRKLGRGGSELSAEDLIALCVYRANAANVLETFVRGRSLYRAPEPAFF